MAKFSTYNYINKLTQMTLFFADNCFHLRMSVEPPKIYQKTSRKARLLTADTIVNQEEKMRLFLQDQLV